MMVFAIFFDNAVLGHFSLHHSVIGGIVVTRLLQLFLFVLLLGGDLFMLSGLLLVVVFAIAFVVTCLS